MSELRWVIGSASVTRVLEQDAGFPAGGFFPSSSPDVLTSHADWLAPWALDGDEQVLISIQALCVESEGTKIVVDTCVTDALPITHRSSDMAPSVAGPIRSGAHMLAEGETTRHADARTDRRP